MPFYCFAQKENVFISEFTPKPSKYMFCYIQLVPKRETLGVRGGDPRSSEMGIKYSTGSKVVK